MRRLLIIASLAGSFIIFALTINLFDALFMLVFFGVLPFGTEPIPALQMLLVYVAAGSIVLSFAARGWMVTLIHSLRHKLTHVKVS